MAAGWVWDPEGTSSWREDSGSTWWVVSEGSMLTGPQSPLCSRLSPSPRPVVFTWNPFQLGVWAVRVGGSLSPKRVHTSCP